MSNRAERDWDITSKKIKSFGHNLINVELNLNKYNGYFNVYMDDGDDAVYGYQAKDRHSCRKVYDKVKNGITMQQLKDIGFIRYN